VFLTGLQRKTLSIAYIEKLVKLKLLEQCRHPCDAMISIVKIKHNRQQQPTKFSMLWVKVDQLFLAITGKF